MAMPKESVVVLNSTGSQAVSPAKLLGFFLIAFFITVWLSSILSPVIFFWAVINGWYILAGSIAVITVAAYAPWEKGVISRFISTLYNSYHPCYYRSTKVIVEDGTSAKDWLESNIIKQQTFFAIHPHGAFCLGWSVLFCSDLMKHVRFCFAPSLYASPLFRLFSRITGNPGSADRSCMIQYMKKGESLALPPGGFEEATLTSTHVDRVFIKKRTGFVKLCLMHGVSIRPVYVFGENKLYSNIQGFWKLRLKLNRYGIPTIYVWGQPLIPLMPKSNVDLTIVIGKPMNVPKIDSPTTDDVAFWHSKYVAALSSLYEKYKEEAMGSEVGKVSKLEVW